MERHFHQEMRKMQEQIYQLEAALEDREDYRPSPKKRSEAREEEHFRPRDEEHRPRR
jgi:hypothetical protein